MMLPRWATTSPSGSQTQPATGALPPARKTAAIRTTTPENPDAGEVAGDVREWVALQT